MSTYRGELEKEEREYQKKMPNKEKLTNADRANHNEFVEKFRTDTTPVWPRDIARVLNLKDMPKPKGKVYKGDEK